MTSVLRRSPLILLTPATYRPSHFTRNLKFLYGSKRFGLTVNSAMPFLLWPGLRRRAGGLLLNADDDELGRLERCEADDDVDDPAVDVVLRGGLGVGPAEV